MVTSNRTYRAYTMVGAMGTTHSFPWAVGADMQALDTSSIVLTISNGVGNNADVGGTGGGISGSFMSVGVRV